MRPIGVPDDEWSVGYGQTFTVDGLPLVGSWGGGGYTARAAARVGRLMLREGDWEGKQLLSKEAVRADHRRRRHARPLRHGLVEQQRRAATPSCPKTPSGRRRRAIRFCSSCRA